MVEVTLAPASRLRAPGQPARATSLAARAATGFSKLAGGNLSPLQARRAGRLSPLVLLLILLFVWPLAMLVAGSFRSTSPFLPGAWTLEAWAQTFRNPGTLTAILNSVKIALISTAAATALAAALAFLSERTDAPLRRLITPAMALVVVTPAVFYAIAFTALANPYSGLLNDALRAAFGLETPWLAAEGWAGVYTVLILKKTAITYLFLLGAFRALDAAQDEAAYIAGAGPVRTFFSINLPSLAPALTSAILLGVVAGLQVFDPVLILGASQRIVVISTLLMNMVGGAAEPQYAQASVLSTVFVAAVASLYLVQQSYLGRRGFVSVAGKGRSARPFRLRQAGPTLGLFIAAYLLIALVLPGAALIVTSLQPFPGVYDGFSLRRYAEVLQWPRVLEAVRVTAILALIVGGATATFAFATAHVVQGLGRGASAAARFSLLIPMAMPGVVTAVAISWAWLSIPAFHQLYGSIWLVILALIVVATPLASQIASAALSQISPALFEAARIGGASPSQGFFEIVLVLAAPSFVAAWFLAALMVAGNLEVPLLLKSPGLNTVAVVAYNMQGSGDFGQAAALLILLLLAALAIWGAGRAVLRLARSLSPRLARPRTAFQPNQESAS